jgi:hypothetical protein
MTTTERRARSKSAGARSRCGSTSTRKARTPSERPWKAVSLPSRAADLVERSKIAQKRDLIVFVFSNVQLERAEAGEQARVFDAFALRPDGRSAELCRIAGGPGDYLRGTVYPRKSRKCGFFTLQVCRVSWRHHTFIIAHFTQLRFKQNSNASASYNLLGACRCDDVTIRSMSAAKIDGTLLGVLL